MSLCLFSYIREYVLDRAISRAVESFDAGREGFSLMGIDIAEQEKGSSDRRGAPNNICGLLRGAH